MPSNRVVLSSGNIQVVLGDITEEETDVIVNAANPSLLGGGGVDGTIHRKAGPGLREECRKLGGCATGEAKLTSGRRLRARWIIHTVGPVWQGGKEGEEEKLASCYGNSLRIASEIGAKSISFPAISTGAYGFPKDKACAIALKTVRKFLQQKDLLVRFVCFDKNTWHTYLNILKGSPED